MVEKEGQDPLVEPSRNVNRDLAMVVLALVSIAILIYDEMVHPVGRLRSFLIVVDLVIVAVFLLEFGARFRAADDKKAFLKRTWYEIPGMVPMAVGELGFLRFFRLFRIVAVTARLFRAKRVANSFLARSNLLNILGIAAFLLFGCAYAEWLLERDSPTGHFANFGEALWWAVVTTTTVGYGDKFPVTLGGRIVAGVLMLTGIGLIGTLAATFSNALIRAPAAAAAPDPRQQRVKDLADLHERGAISDAEFAAGVHRVLRES